MKLRTFLKPFSFLPAILLMYLIYSFSAQEGDVSTQTSYKVSRTVVSTANELFDANLEPWQIDDYAVRFNGVIRKLAHMTEYFLLAIAVSFPLYVYGLHGILLMLVAGVICVAFAAGDEYHQMFVAGRASSTKDVLIDSGGVFLGILVTRFIGWTGRMTLLEADSKKQYSNGYDDGYQRGIEEARRQEEARERKQEDKRRREEAREKAARKAEEKAARKAEEKAARKAEENMTYAQRAARMVEEEDERYPADTYWRGASDDPGYDDPAGDSDDLSDDMPFSRFLKRRR